MPKKPIRKPLGVRILTPIIEEIDQYVDGFYFRTRAHLVEVALQKFVWELKSGNTSPKEILSCPDPRSYEQPKKNQKKGR